eukprot:g1722.t1
MKSQFLLRSPAFKASPSSRSTTPRQRASRRDRGESPGEPDPEPGATAQCKGPSCAKVRAAVFRDGPPKAVAFERNESVTSQIFHLKWTVSDSEADYCELREGALFNHFQKNRELTTKVGLANNLRRFACEEQVDIDRFFPRCYDMSSASDVQEMFFDLSGWAEGRSEFQEEGRGSERRKLYSEEWDALVLYSELSDAQLCGDDAEAERKRRQGGYSASGAWQPGTGREGVRVENHQKWPEFRDHYWGEAPEHLRQQAQVALEQLEARWPQFSAQGPMNVWVAKPGSCSKGKGVICSSGSWPYIERPLLLFSGRKFDLRQWVLVRSFQPLKVHMFSSCYLRLCNEPYDLGDLANRQRHISNWSVNKCGKHVSDGAVASLQEFQEVLEMITGKSNYWETELIPQLKSCILQTLQAVQSNMVQRPESFEVYGFDFLIGEDLKPWLLEVNLSPACESRTQWMSDMLERMASRLVELLLQGHLLADGKEPDWVCICDETANVKGEDPMSCWLENKEDLSETWGHKDLTVVGKALSKRAARRLDQIWRRNEAQIALARTFRGCRVRWRLRAARQRACAHLVEHARARAWATLLRRCATHRWCCVSPLFGGSRGFRGFQCRNGFRFACHSALCIQRAFKGFLARRRLQMLRRFATLKQRWLREIPQAEDWNKHAEGAVEDATTRSSTFTPGSREDSETGSATATGSGTADEREISIGLVEEPRLLVSDPSAGPPCEPPWAIRQALRVWFFHPQHLARSFDAILASSSARRAEEEDEDPPSDDAAPSTGSALRAARQLRVTQGYTKPTVSSTRRTTKSPKVKGPRRAKQEADLNALLMRTYVPQLVGPRRAESQPSPWRLSNIEPEPRVLPLGECRELELRLGEGDQGWQCPAPALSHELLCAAPLKSDDSSGQSMTQIPQTRPELPPLVPGAVAARQTVYNQEVPSVQPTAPANVGYPDGGRKLRKPKWMKVKSLKPDARGVNLLVKVVKVTEVDSKLFEVVLGDDTGCVTLRARPEMVELCKPGAILRVQNALIVMHKGTMRLEVNKWGVLKPEPGEEIQVNEKNDVSAVEYERAKA